eukprot:scaffold12205_cov33-Tisochrysis_lutea.AAC.3
MALAHLCKRTAASRCSRSACTLFEARRTRVRLWIRIAARRFLDCSARCLCRRGEKGRRRGRATVVIAERGGAEESESPRRSLGVGRVCRRAREGEIGSEDKTGRGSRSVALPVRRPARPGSVSTFSLFSPLTL